LARDTEIDFRQFGLLTMVLIIGLVLSFVITRQSVISAENQVEERFHSDAKLFVGHLENEIRAGIQAADDLFAYYFQSETFEQKEYRLLIKTNSNLSNHRSLVAPVNALTLTNSDEFLSRIRSFFGPGFKVFEPANSSQASGDVTKFPIYIPWSNDPARAKALLGLNVGGDPAVNRLLTQSIADGLASVIFLPTFPELDQGKSGQVLIVSPYTTREGNPAALLQVVDIKGMIAEIAADLPDLEKAFQLQVMSSWGESSFQQGFGAVDETLVALDGLKFGGRIEFGTAIWEVDVFANPGAYPVNYNSAFITASVCFLLTGLFFFIVWSQRQRGQRVAAIVNRRTRALKEAHVELEEHYKLLQDLNKDVEEARRSAVSANRAKSEFLATMSHELRTPLNAILGFSQLIQDQAIGPVGDERYVEYSKDIHDSGQHLLSLINDILDLAKLESGNVSIDKNPVLTSDLADRIISLLSQQADNKGVEFKTEVDENMPDQILGDELRLRQIMINLCSNAIKFTQQGSVVVRLFAKPFQNGMAGWVLEVQDTGIGIPEEKQATLFDRFTQVDAALSRRHGGVGLGLAICRELVDRMEGKITVRSMVNVGTAIRVHLPMLEQDEDLIEDQMTI